MHSSRMCTARRSSCHGGLHTPLEQTPPSEQALPSPLARSHSTSPLGVGLDQIPLNFPLGCGPGPDPISFPLGCVPGSAPPQLLPWLWAWTRSPSTSPLGVGLETCKACWNTTPPPETCCKAYWDTTPPRGQTDTCKNITFANYVR